MGRQADCIFCKIVAGEIPSSKIAESPEACAFLDVGPVAEGHALVVPRNHYGTLAEMPPEEVAAVFRLAARIAPVLREAVGAEGVNLLLNDGRCAGQLVGHVHVHLIPRRSGDGLGFAWPAHKAAPEALARLARKIASSLDAS